MLYGSVYQCMIEGATLFPSDLGSCIDTGEANQMFGLVEA